MRKRAVPALAAGFAALSAGATAGAAGPSPALHRDFTGVASAVEWPAFSLRTSPRQTVRFVANDRTSWSPACRSFTCVKLGHRLVVHARPGGGRWVALTVTRHYVHDAGGAQDHPVVATG